MGFLSVLKSNPDVRKLFGERELVIIEKQLLGVPLTQSEKNRLSRDIRRKLKAISALAGFEPEFSLKKSSEIKRWVDEALQTILKSGFSPSIKKIFLFGSAVENKLSLRSDIDICVEFNKISKEEANLFRKEILGIANQRIDVQVFNVLPSKIQKEILAKGKVLYERPHSGQNP
ncbi:MAG: nucleotidyltransferase domain-containing protein [Candidatus ainarchaeum sp.]|nr:nucleotidyltransferase domain-containing protein [Candidatus ainarchaeum sp.]